MRDLQKACFDIFPSAVTAIFPALELDYFEFFLQGNFINSFFSTSWQFGWNKSLWAGVRIFLAQNLAISLDEWNPRLLKFCWKEDGAKSCIRWLDPPLHHVSLNFQLNSKSSWSRIALCTRLVWCSMVFNGNKFSFTVSTRLIHRI